MSQKMKRCMAFILALGLSISMLYSDVAVLSVNAASVSGPDVILPTEEVQPTEPATDEITTTDESETTVEESSIEESTEETPTETVTSEEETLTEETVTEELTTEEVSGNSIQSNQLNSVITDYSFTIDAQGVLSFVQTNPAVTRPHGGVIIPVGTKIIPKAENLFFNNPDVTSITFSDEQLTTIEANAFFNLDCKRITIPQNVTSIGDQAFQFAKFTQVFFKNSETAVTIGKSAFADCYNLEEVDTNGRIAILGDSAFANCKILADTINLTGVTSIGKSAFYNCSSLKYITIPSTVPLINEKTFMNCTSLGQADAEQYKGLGAVKLGEGVTKIGREAFSGCTGLEQVKLPGSVTEVDTNAYYGCTGLAEIMVLNQAGANSTCNILLNYNSFPARKNMIMRAYDGTVEEWVGSHAGFGVKFASLFNTFSISFRTMQNGTVSTKKKNVRQGERVALSVTPAEGYQLKNESIVGYYTDSVTGPENLEVDEDYTFIMPASDVEIKATFIKKTDAKYGAELLKDTIESLNVDDNYNRYTSYLEDNEITWEEDNKKLTFAKAGESAILKVKGKVGGKPAWNELSFVSSNSKVATVDNHGRVYAVGAGSCNITISLVNNVDNTKAYTYKVCVTEKINITDIDFIYDKGRTTVQETDDPDVNGSLEAKAAGYDIITFSSNLVNLSQMSFKVTAIGKAAGKNVQAAYDWSALDKSMLSLSSTTSRGVSNTITMKQGAKGETVVTAKAKDGSKLEKKFIVRVIDTTPRLGSSTITVDPQSVTGTKVDFVEIYGYGIDVSSLEIQKKVVSKGITSFTKLGQDETALVRLINSDDDYYLKVNGETSTNGNVTFDKGKNYKYTNTYYIYGKLAASEEEFNIPIPTLNICKKKISPKLKATGKINLFYKGNALPTEIGSVVLSQTTKGLTVQDMQLANIEKANGKNNADDTSFTSNFSISMNADKTATIKRTTNDLKTYQEGTSKGKAVVKGIVNIWFEGYENPYPVTVTIPTCTTAPRYELTTKKVTANTNATGHQYTVAFRNTKTKLIEDLIEATEIRLDESDKGTTHGLLDSWSLNTDENNVSLILGMVQKGKVVFILDQPTWESTIPVKATLTVSATSTYPSVKFGKTTLNLNKRCDGVDDSTTMVLNQTDAFLTESQEFEPSGRLQNEAISVTYDNGKITASASEEVPAGTYKFICTPTFKFLGYDLTRYVRKTSTIYVKVVDKTPSIKLKSSSFVINANCNEAVSDTQYDSITKAFTWVNLPAEYADYELNTDNLDLVSTTRIDQLSGMEGVHVTVDGANRTVKVSLKQKVTGKNTYKVTGLVLSKEGVEDIPIADFKITVQGVNKTPAVTVSPKGSINPLDTTSSIIYTPKVSNVGGSVNTVSLRELAADGSRLEIGTEHFMAIHNPATGKTSVYVKPGVTLENRTYKIQFTYTISNGTYECRVIKDQSIKPKQTMPKLKTDVKSAVFFAGNKAITKKVKITKTSTATANITKVKFSDKTSKSLQEAFALDSDSYNAATGELTLKLKNSAFIKQNVEQVLTFEIECEGQLHNTKGTTFTVKVKVLK